MKLYSSAQKLNDHRNIGKKLDYFCLKKEAPGMPFMLSNGLKIKNKLIEYWRVIHQLNDYMEIESPILLDKDLWRESGHLEYFSENMFFSKVDDKEFALKPMSCPGAILLYKDQKRSYKELPLRLAELGRVHRNENSGSLQGLLRVRSFVQDDAHIFCEKFQIYEEILNFLKICFKILNHCGFKDFKFELSLKGDQSKYLGEESDWIYAQNSFIKVLDELKLKYEIKEGEAKFYGPSLDLHMLDSQGKYWQCSSIQLDFNLAKKFNLKYFDEDNNEQIPYILHRVVFGSIERFMGILLENSQKRLPFWLNPMQFKIMLIDRKSKEYAFKLYKKLIEKGFLGSIDLSEKSLSNKIKNSFNEKVVFNIIIGEKERLNGKYSVSKYDQLIKGSFSYNELIKVLK